MSKEERKLKPVSQRKPKESVSYPELINKVSKETKYRKSDVKLVIDTMLKIASDSVKQKKSIRFPKIGTIFPTIKKSRVGMALNGGVGKPKKMMVPDRWMARFQTSTDLEQDLFKLEVTPEELDALYKK